MIEHNHLLCTGIETLLNNFRYQFRIGISCQFGHFIPTDIRFNHDLLSWFDKLFHATYFCNSTPEHIDIDWIEAAHGRALAVATAVKRLYPGNLVFTYQGDGDLSAIGTAESIHAAARGENVVAIYINNAIYGMTGGQMAPTTLLGMKTATTPYGRDPRLNGYPYKIAEMMAHLDGATFITRQSVHTPANVRKCKRAIRKAFENSMAGKGFSLVEVVSTCNSGWKLSPVASNEWLEQNMLPYYPLGDIKDVK